jgi:CrcB protein
MDGWALTESMMRTYLAVMFGGALGSALRMWLSNACAARFGDTFPFGTLATNVSGCFAIGIFAALTGPDGSIAVPLIVRQFVTLGVLGGFTTFSTFGLQTYQLIASGDWLRATLNMLASLLLCMLGVWLGHLSAGWFQQS